MGELEEQKEKVKGNKMPGEGEMATEEEKIAEVSKAEEEFVREYMMVRPFSEYINMVGITFRFIAEWRKQRGDGAPAVSFEYLKRELVEIEEAERMKEKLIHSGENPEEYCIHVGLERPLPEGVSLPDTYKGFKVFVMVIGEIRLL